MTDIFALSLYSHGLRTAGTWWASLFVSAIHPPAPPAPDAGPLPFTPYESLMTLVSHPPFTHSFIHVAKVSITFQVLGKNSKCQWHYVLP